jgi:hypothetical protein
LSTSGESPLELAAASGLVGGSGTGAGWSAGGRGSVADGPGTAAGFSLPLPIATAAGGAKGFSAGSSTGLLMAGGALGPVSFDVD